MAKCHICSKETSLITWYRIDSIYAPKKWQGKWAGVAECEECQKLEKVSE